MSKSRLTTMVRVQWLVSLCFYLLIWVKNLDLDSSMVLSMLHCILGVLNCTSAKEHPFWKRIGDPRNWSYVYWECKKLSVLLCRSMVPPPLVLPCPGIFRLPSLEKIIPCIQYRWLVLYYLLFPVLFLFFSEISSNMCRLEKIPSIQR